LFVEHRERGDRDGDEALISAAEALISAAPPLTPAARK
jgi:hypothetical protein